MDCQTILKTGLRKGQACGRKAYYVIEGCSFCKMHKPFVGEKLSIKPVLKQKISTKMANFSPRGLTGLPDLPLEMIAIYLLEMGEMSSFFGVAYSCKRLLGVCENVVRNSVEYQRKTKMHLLEEECKGIMRSLYDGIKKDNKGIFSFIVCRTADGVTVGAWSKYGSYGAIYHSSTNARYSDIIDQHALFFEKIVFLYNIASYFIHINTRKNVISICRKGDRISGNVLYSFVYS